ncbi:MAG: tail fiber domain-containing protein [Thermoanaerobaculales bacterium]
MTVHRAALAVITLCVSALALAQPADPPLVNWPAPPYWTPPTPQHVTRPQAPSAPASSRDRDVSVESTPETPLTAALPFIAVTPCRLVDTRHGPKDVQQPGGSTPGFPRGQFASGEIRSYDLTSSADCTGLPAGVGAWSLQFQFTTQGGSGVPAYLVAWPYDSGLGVGKQSAPANESTMLGYGDRWTANSAVIPAGNDGNGSIDVYVQNAGDVIVEVNGYYGPQGVVTSLTGGGSKLTGDVTLGAGSNIAITPSGNTLTIAMSGVPGGTLPAGAAAQTLYSNGSGWLASSALTNDGTNVGISGNLSFPSTTASTGQIKLGGSLFLHDYGNGSTFLGHLAGNLSLTGNYNTGLGSESLIAIGSGSYNTGVGSAAVFADSSGSDNTGVGAGALGSNVSASQNTAVGSSALGLQSFDPKFSYPSDNTAVGYQALYNNQPDTAGDGYGNTAVGSQALQANTTGQANTANGYESLYSNTTGTGNTASGQASLYGNTTAQQNTAVGQRALYTQSYSNGNLAWNSNNTALGWEALYFNQPDTKVDGNDNTAVGVSALHANTTGSSNTASGYQSLSANTTGSYNIAIGWEAGVSLDTGSSNIDIGNGGMPGEGATIRIGDSNQTNTYIAGIWGVSITGADVLIDKNGHLGSVASSLRFKQDVADMGDASSRLMELRPVTFHYKTQPDGPLQYGLIAEEVQDVMPELVVKDAMGQPETVAYHELPAMLLNELQKQRATIQAEQTKLEVQKAEIEALKAQLRERHRELERRLAALEHGQK